MDKKIIMFCAAIALTSQAFAGFAEFTMHSRANCAGFNESISWHFKHSYWLLTHTRHTNPDAPWICDFWSADDWEITWRSAALHFAEGWNGQRWYVVGNHWTTPDAGMTSILMSTTDAVDCNIYDGWWDAN